MDYLIYTVPVSCIIALAFAYGLASWISRLNAGTDYMKDIAMHIHEGAMAYLKREYKTMLVVVIIMFLILGIGIGWLMAVNYLIGAGFSVLSGFIGMNVATKANVRTANAAREVGMNQALKVAFRGGAVMGLCLVGLGLLGISVFFIVLGIDHMSVITGFSLGASSMALFSRVSSGTYTKAGAAVTDSTDPTGTEKLGEALTHPRLIVDNASDISGMGSDLFESYVGAIISAIILALSGTALNPTAGVLFPIVLSAIGILASLIGIMFVRGKENSNPASALNRGTYISGGIVLVFALVLSMGLFKSLNNGFAIAAGLLVGIAIGKLTELYTSSNHRYVQKIAANCETGPATAIISGIGTGMISTVGPIMLIVVGIIIAFNAAGLYGIALAAVGMLSTTGMVVAVDAYGPISENAGGIAEMSNLPKSVRTITDNLYTVGLSTTAIGKGFAIGSAAMTAIALLVAYAQVAGLKTINLMNPMVMGGLFLGAVLPFFFAALTMGASRKAALKNLILPGIISVAVPIAAGLLMGTAALGALLAGATVAGVILAIMMANAGGAWDNAKRYIENGHYGGKFSIAHEAAMVGDEVGNPLQDISGPSINILIKLMAIVALVFAPMLVAFGGSI